MKSDTPKVLHALCGKPILGHILDTVDVLNPRRVIVVAGAGEPAVARFAEERAEVVRQKTPCGTGHALLQAQNPLKGFEGSVLVLCGDAPLVSSGTLRKLVRQRAKTGTSCALLSFEAPDPAGYGRIIRGEGGLVQKIVEESNATDEQKRVREVNSGVYCFRARDIFTLLGRLKPDPVKKEIYLTDAVELLVRRGGVRVSRAKDPREALGVNSREDLAMVTAVRKDRILKRLMRAGVTIVDPATTFIEERVRVGRDTVIYPNTVIEGPARIGGKCRVGPFARIRAGVALGDGVTVGNFVEVVRTRIGRGSTAKHLTYLGDAEIGSGVNVGAGTITANYDGKRKHRTVIRDGARIGSGTVLVAPVRVGKGARTGAGAVLPRGRNVAAGVTVAGVPARKIPRQKRKGS